MLKRTMKLYLIVMIGFLNLSSLHGSNKLMYSENVAVNTTSWFGNNSSLVKAFFSGFALSVAATLGYKYCVSKNSAAHTTRGKKNLNDDEAEPYTVGTEDDVTMSKIDDAIANAYRAHSPRTPRAAAIIYLRREKDNYYRMLLVRNNQLIQAKREKDYWYSQAQKLSGGRGQVTGYESTTEDSHADHRSRNAGRRPSGHRAELRAPLNSPATTQAAA